MTVPVLARVASAGALRRRVLPLGETSDSPGRRTSTQLRDNAEEEKRQKLMELELEHIGKYKWREEFLVPAISARLVVHPAYIAELADCCPASAAPRPNLKPDLQPPTEHLALIITVGCFADPTLSALPQTTIDGERLRGVLTGLGFTVRQLTTASIERRRAADDRAAQLKSQTPWSVQHNSESEEVDRSQIPTKANVMREVSRALRLHRGNHIASLLVFFSGRGLLHNALEVSDSPAKLLACYDTKPSLFSTYFPVEVLSAIRLERTLTVADLAPFHPNNGLGFIASDVVGGRLEFQYPPLQGFTEVFGARSSLLMGLMIRGFRGKAARDLRLTPNNLNVYVAHRLMALKWKLFTSASPWQTGAWDMAPRAAVFSQRKDMRAFRESKRREWASFRAKGVVSEYSARNLQTVASQLLTRVRTANEIALGEDRIQLSTLAFDGRVFLAFQTKEAYASGVVEAEGHCRRTLPKAVVAREAIHLRLAVQTVNTSHQAMADAVAALAEHRQRKRVAAVVLVGVEAGCISSKRGERKFDWAARAGHFAPLVAVEAVEADKDQLHRIESAITIQAVWRGYRHFRRFNLIRVLLGERESVASELRRQWVDGWRTLAAEVHQSMRSSLEATETEIREAIEQNGAEYLDDLLQEVRYRFTSLVLRSRGRYQFYRHLSLIERRRATDKGLFSGLTWFREDVLTDPAASVEGPFGVLLQCPPGAELRSPSAEDPFTFVGVSPSARSTKSVDYSFGSLTPPATSTSILDVTPRRTGGGGGGAGARLAVGGGRGLVSPRSPTPTPTSTALLSEGPSYSVIRSRAEISGWEEAAYLFILTDFWRRWIEIDEAEKYRPWIGFLNLPWDVEQGCAAVAKQEHQERLAVVSLARRYLVIPTRAVPTQPIAVKW